VAAQPILPRYHFAETSEGLLRIFVNEDTVREIDQRYVPIASTEPESVYVGDLPAGTHRIAFRLDGYGANPSGVELTEVELGQEALQESTPVAYTLSISKTGSGTVTSNPAGIACGNSCTANFASGINVALIATPVSGSRFTGWGGACSGSGACTVTMSAARNVTTTFNTGAYSPTTSDILTALYDAYFLRAPDLSGFDYWNNQSNSNALSDLSSGFFGHPYAQATLGYSSMTDRAFATAIYQNVLRGTGTDTPGASEIDYWANWLAQPGHSRPGMVLQFISDALSLDTSALTDPAVRDAAKHRQDTLWNKVEVAQTFMSVLGSQTNVSAAAAADPNLLAADPAFRAGQRILEGITYDIATRDCAKDFITTVASNPNPISAINTASHGALFCIP